MLHNTPVLTPVRVIQGAKWKKKKKKFIKPQYNNSINTQHCGRLSEKTNVHHAGHLNRTRSSADADNRLDAFSR